MWMEGGEKSPPSVEDKAVEEIDYDSEFGIDFIWYRRTTVLICPESEMNNMRKQIGVCRRVICLSLLMLIICLCCDKAFAATTLSSSPNAKVEYSYTSSVSAGTIRYIQQNTGGYFNSSYWGGWAGQASGECGTASASMALSYVGINKTPNDILTANNGITYFSGWGETSFLRPSISTGMDNYVNGNGKYSPVIIHLPKYSSAGHYVILVGKKSSNVYQALDPWNGSAGTVWDITINGTSASYFKGTDTINEVMQYYKSYNPYPAGTQTISDGDYNIVSAINNDYGLSVKDDSLNSGANVHLWKMYADNANQVFNVKYLGNGYYKITNKHSGKVLDVLNSGTADRTNVIQFNDKGTDNQAWVIKQAGDGVNYNIISKCNGLSLDVSGGSATNGTNIQMWKGTDTNQRWRFIAYGPSVGQTIPNGRYSLLSRVDTTKGMDIAQVGTVNLQLYLNTRQLHQTFDIEYLGDGFYKITDAKSGKSLDVTNGGSYQGNNVSISDYSTSKAKTQNWIIKHKGGGWYNIISKGNGMCLDVTGGNSDNRTNIEIYRLLGSAAQDWALLPIKTNNKIKFELEGGKVAGPIAQRSIDGFNTGRGLGHLTVYECKNFTSTTNHYGSEAAVDKDGKVIKVRPYDSDSHLTVPENGFIMSGHCENGNSSTGSNFVNKLSVGRYAGYDYSTKIAYAYDSIDSYLIDFKYVSSSGTYGSLPIPEREGYTFEGWYTSKTGGTKVTRNSKYSVDTLYARWTKDEDYAPAARSEFNGHRYEVYDMPVSWTAAKAFCEKQGGHLITITSKEENDFAVQLAKNGSQGFYYIGCTGSNNQSVWKWINGERFSYTSWDPSLPEPNVSPNEDYGAIIIVDNPPNKQSGEWINVVDKETTSGYYEYSNSGFICEYEATAEDIAGASVTGIVDKAYTGSAVTQTPVVKLGDKTLTKGTDYILAYSNNIEVGEATITILGKGSYTGKIEKTFYIAGTSISDATVTGIEDREYTGSAITQTPVVKLGDKTLVKDEDYSLAYTDNIEIGTASLSIKGKGGYTGTIVRNFNITGVNIAKAEVTGITDSAYTGSAVTQKPVVKIDNKTLVKDTDYTVNYTNNTNVGVATVTIKGIGKYTGTLTKTFKIEDTVPSASAEYSNHLYELYDVSMSWTKAKAFCENKGGHLVTISGKEENDQIVTLAKKGSKYFYYIGCIGSNNQSVWKWITNEGFNYTNWDPDNTEPNVAEGEDYGAIISVENSPNKQPGEWINITNEETREGYYHYNHAGFICEFDSASESIADASVTGIENAKYTGSPITPTPTVKLGDKILVKDRDYTVSYTNNTDVGTAIVIITGKDGYNGTTSKTFRITLGFEDAIVLDIADKTYTGSAVKPAPSVKLNGMTLERDADYTVSYSDNVNVGTAKITISGKGSYSGKIEKTFNIIAANIDDVEVTGIEDVAYEGSAVKPTPLVKLGDVTLEEGRDYTVIYKDNSKVGTAIVIITGKGNYTGTTAKSFRILNSFERATVADIEDETYTGMSVKPELVVELDGKILKRNRDYSVSYSNNINAGTGKVIIEGEGDYSGEIEKTFRIMPANIDVAKISDIRDVEYIGQEIMPSPLVKIDDKTLEEDKDYTLSYTNNTEVGTAIVIITGTGNYKGTTATSFKIVKKEEEEQQPKKVKFDITLSSKTYTWNGKIRKPSVTVKVDGKKLSSDNYTVKYAKGLKSVGKYSITVTLKGNYEGSKTAYFTVNPKNTTMKAPAKASKALTAKWSKLATKMSTSRITGYQVQAALNSKFTKSVKTVNVKGYSKTSKKIIKLKAKKKYYVRVRTYMTVKGKIYYSSWSKVKTVKTK